MKINKVILYVLTAVVLALQALAVPMPSPVLGTVEFNGVPADGVNVVVTNLATGEVLTSADVAQLKSDRGIFGFDLLYFKQGFTLKDRRGSGDTLEIRVCSVVPECVYSYELVNTDVKSVELKVFSPNLPSQVVITSPPVTTYVCSDGSVVSNAAACPIVPPIVEKVYACADGTQVSNLTDCPLTKLNVLQILSGAGIGGAVAFAALVAYYWKKGKKERAKKMLDSYLKRKK